MTHKQTPKKQKPINAARPGDPVECVLRVLEKRTQRTRAGKAYLALKLGDKSADIPARVWEDADYFGGLFESGDFVFVQGLAETFNRTLQLRVTHLERVSPDAIDPTDFDRASPFDSAQMSDDLRLFIGAHVERSEIKTFLFAILDADEVADRLLKAPAAKGNHHAYVAGLLEHTLSMVRLAAVIADHYQSHYAGLIDRDLVIAGAVLHDIGKLWELSQGLGIDYTDEGRLVGHVVIGAELVTRTLERLGIEDKELALRLKHLVLSHHGELQFGAAIKPQTPEAQLLHYIDQIDARMNMFAEAIGDGDEKWSKYVRPLERFVYAGSTRGTAEVSAARNAAEPTATPASEKVSAAHLPDPLAREEAEAQTEEPTGWDEPPFHLYEEEQPPAGFDSTEDDPPFDVGDASADGEVVPPTPGTSREVDAAAAQDLSDPNDPTAAATETAVGPEIAGDADQVEGNGDSTFVDRLTLDLFSDGA